MVQQEHSSPVTRAFCKKVEIFIIDAGFNPEWSFLNIPSGSGGGQVCISAQKSRLWKGNFVTMVLTKEKRLCF